jgi:hypothetical protein
MKTTRASSKTVAHSDHDPNVTTGDVPRSSSTPRSNEEDRAARLARIDPSTLSAPELELIEMYRAAPPTMRAAMLTIMRFAVKGGA